MGPNRVLGHTGGSQGTSLIFQSWQDLGASTRFTGERSWLWTFFVSQIWPPRPRNLPWDRTGYLDTREVHRQQVWFSKLTGPGSIYQVHREEILAPDKLFLLLFFKIDLLDLGTCPRTQHGTLTHGMFIGDKFDFQPWQDFGPSTIFTVKKNWFRTNFFIFFTPQNWPIRHMNLPWDPTG